MPSLYQLHIETWKDGCGADICSRAHNRCFARGKIPCDVLFIGEAPGQSEDCVGIPFIGPAGQLLDRIINRAFRGFEHSPRCAITNLVGCIPRYDAFKKEKKKYGQPSDEDINCCKERLEEFITICNPQLIVGVGAMARDELVQGYKHSIKLPHRDIKIIDIIHPAAIMKVPIATRGLMEQRAVIQLKNAMEEVIEGKYKAREEPSRDRDIERLLGKDDIPF